MTTLARALVLLALGGGAAQAADEPALLPTYAVGHPWPLADATYELTRIEDGQYVFAAPAAEIRLSRTLGLAGARRGGEYFELTPPAELKWPLKPGDWGTARTDWRASRYPDTVWGRTRWAMTNGRLTWSVEGWEDVALGRGTVRALRIRTGPSASSTSSWRRGAIWGCSAAARSCRTRRRRPRRTSTRAAATARPPTRRAPGGAARATRSSPPPV